MYWINHKARLRLFDLFGENKLRYLFDNFIVAVFDDNLMISTTLRQIVDKEDDDCDQLKYDIFMFYDYNSSIFNLRKILKLHKKIENLIILAGGRHYADVLISDVYAPDKADVNQQEIESGESVKE